MDITKQKKRNEKLNREQLLKLIAQVKQYPELWCKSYKHYRNINRQESAWVRISRELDIIATDAKYNWSALLANFRVYRAKVKKSQVPGSGHDDIYRPCWFAYESMLFTGSSNVVETTDTIGLARPTSHSQCATAMLSTVTSQVPCSSQNSSPTSASASNFSVDITPDISNNISNSPTTDLFTYLLTYPITPAERSLSASGNLSTARGRELTNLFASFNGDLSNDLHSSQNADSTLLPPASTHRAPTPPVAPSPTTRHPHNELAASLQALVDTTNRHMQRASSRIAIDIANWIDNFDSRQQILVIGKLYQAMNSIEMEINERS